MIEWKSFWHTRERVGEYYLNGHLVYEAKIGESEFHEIVEALTRAAQIAAGEIPPPPNSGES